MTCWQGPPQLALRRPLISITPKPSNAELVTFVVMHTRLGFASGARWLPRA
ncbi:hypothetical protein OHA71_32840 [Streptomyces sp. NBC_00444]|uniref:hypothetical protein n=1 Tax=Streptomyces sp. NBC_00444 TaxID=2975744 RepID=UPI002E1EB191